MASKRKTNFFRRKPYYLRSKTLHHKCKKSANHSETPSIDKSCNQFTYALHPDLSSSQKEPYITTENQVSPLQPSPECTLVHSRMQELADDTDTDDVLQHPEGQETTLVHNRLVELTNAGDVDDFLDQPDSQELMPPPIFHEVILRDSRSKSKEDEDGQSRKRRNTRSSSRSTVILSDDENDIVKERMANYLKRSPSKQLKRSEDFGLSIPSRASSRSTVIFSSSESL